MSRPFDLPAVRPRLTTRNAFVVVIPLVLAVVSACSKPETELPISRDELPAVLIEIYVAQAEAEIDSSNFEDARSEALRRHGYDLSEFDETMRLLTEDPALAKQIYQTVLDSVIFEQRDIRAKSLTPTASGQASNVNQPAPGSTRGRTSDSLAVEATE